MRNFYIITKPNGEVSKMTVKEFSTWKKLLPFKPVKYRVQRMWLVEDRELKITKEDKVCKKYNIKAQ